VASALVKFIKTGSTLAAVNFPELDLRPSTTPRPIRIINIHHNVPGVLKQINKVLSEFNIEKQQCDSKDSIAYFIADVTIEVEDDLRAIYELLGGISESISTRIVYAA
jgi:D-3-phosphoglycerate dehydrogenase / 2-oxoglutarate reductase